MHGKARQAVNDRVAGPAWPCKVSNPPPTHLSARTVMRDRLLNSAWHTPTVTPSRLH